MLAAVLAGCTFHDAFRGTDRGATMPGARARWLVGDGSAPSDPDRVSYESTIEASFTHVDGDFTRAGTRADYRFGNGHLAFAPEVSWRRLCLCPIAGLAYGDIEVENGTARASAEGLGATLGIQASWRGWRSLEPYVRYVEAGDPEWHIARFEAGVEVGLCEQLGVQFAYARQTSRIDEVFSSNDGARIETEGLHLGLSLRF
jgi:hypothetical protein